MSDVYLFDVDGTLSIHGKIPQSTIDGITQLKEQGDYILLSTGRCLGQLDDILSQIPVDGAILNNGALLRIQDEIVFSSPIYSSTIQKMLDDGLHLGFLREKDYVRIENHLIFDKFKKEFTIQAPTKINMDELESKPIYSIGVYDENLSDIDVSQYPDLRFVQVCSIGYDVMNVNIHKASAIQSLRSYFPKSRIIAFGDNYNDMELLIASDIGIAMGNAPQEVKNCARYTTTSILEDGISYALKNILRSIK